MTTARERQRHVGVHAALCLLVLPALMSAQQPGGAAPTSLTIVVVEGEGAVNIIQQKTAVRAIVEVRDRNHLPVSGATVTFKVGGQGGTALSGGSPTITVTTNTACHATGQARMMVNYEGRALFDSGCIGAATGMQSLSYAGRDTAVTVRVIPNCAGGSATSWEYRLSCSR
jgi:hypothetical protein